MKMTQREEIIEALKELLAFREKEYESACEFNCFNSSGSESYLSRTHKIEELCNELSNRDSCNLKKELTLEEAIQHAEEVSEKNDSPCCQQHKQLASWLSELKNLRTQHAYLQADFQNFKKRVERDHEVSKTVLKKELVLKILPLVDDFERVMEQIECHERLDDIGDLDVGVELIYKNLLKTLEELGTKKIECEEAMSFDVNFHEAISTKSISELDDSESKYFSEDSIYKVFQSGWMLDEEVIRPAKVMVVK